MRGRWFPAPEQLERALARHLGRSGVRVRATQHLSPGLGPATVLRVHADVGDTGTSRWIAKIPAGGNRSLLEAADPALVAREARFFRSPLPAALPAGLGTPPEAGVVRHDGRDWIFMREVTAAMDHRWTPADALHVARRLSLLHAPVMADPTLLDTAWLERNGYAGYAHHVAAGHRNLDLLGTDPELAGPFPPAQLRRLHRSLDALDRLTVAAGRITPTLLHGDVQVRNLGLAGDGTLLLIDWEHVGVGPVGFDLATFVSLYRLFGGTGELDEPAMVAEYGVALSEVAGRDLRRDAELGFALCHLTWGLHLRLGPGQVRPRRSGVGGRRPWRRCSSGDRPRRADRRPVPSRVGRHRRSPPPWRRRPGPGPRRGPCGAAATG